jgi:tRNA pseudouridine38-40 synthase
VKVALRIAYDGSAFDSYARQPGRRTVEGALQEALGPEGLVGLRTGSRTDAKVSALENVLLADLDRPHLRGLLPAVQGRLPDGLWVTGAAAAPAGFDPRKAAWRQYRYLAPRSGEDEASLRTAAQAFLGTHDVRAFARLEPGRDPRRTVLAFDVAGQEGLWSFTVRGQSFLWGQVRRMVDAALACGRGQASIADIHDALRSGRKHPRFAVAPAEGLLLERVHHEGLAWDLDAGGVDGRHVAADVVRSRVRLDVASHVSGLASNVVGRRA